MRKVIQNFVTGGTLAVSLAASLSMMAPPRLAAEDASSGGQCESDNYGEAVLGFEGGGNQYATNPNSTATGSYQFLFGTLVELGYIEAGQSRRRAAPVTGPASSGPVRMGSTAGTSSWRAPKRRMPLSSVSPART